MMAQVEWTKSGIPSKESIIDAAAAGMVSRHDDEYKEFMPDISFERAKEFLKKMIRLGHDSVLEHIVFQFWVSISRVASHQLVRHRIASYTQKSHRKERKLTLDDFVIPEQLDGKDREEWIDDIKKYIKTYEKWLEKGYAVDIARRKLPQETRTDLIMTINARSLRNFFRLRAEHVADFEIRDMALKMHMLIEKENLIFLFEDIPIE
ncbi:MAG: FAD-dependent thymidylate synthase [Candidatus Lokiarchaeota archaeon]|nr:FAD-dependent thymidylate synthase [Candidatus Lokiarchaeota archaeon]